jgi:ferredoxin
MPRVRFLNDEIEFQCPAGTSLPRAANDAMASLPFGCRAGTCGTCAIKVVEGAEGLPARGFVEEDTLAVTGKDGHNCRLACQLILGDRDVSIRWDED